MLRQGGGEACCGRSRGAAPPRRRGAAAGTAREHVQMVLTTAASSLGRLLQSGVFSRETKAGASWAAVLEDPSARLGDSRIASDLCGLRRNMRTRSAPKCRSSAAWLAGLSGHHRRGVALEPPLLEAQSMGRTMEMGSVMLAGELAGSRTALCGVRGWHGRGWRFDDGRGRRATRRAPQSKILRPSLESVAPDWGNDVNARNATDRPNMFDGNVDELSPLLLGPLCASFASARAANSAPRRDPGLVDASEPFRHAPGRRQAR